MARLVLHLGKSVEENASLYYESAKKAKKKTEGAQKALQSSLKKLEELEAKKATEEKKEKKFISSRKKEWYEKFRWFISSEGLLVIAGRDSGSNELLIKKYADKEDTVFHTDIRGSPFVVVKAQGKAVGEATMREAADFACTFSKAWKLGLATTPVFYVKPEQVSKEPRAGEYLTKGAFIIKGKTAYIENKANCAVGMTDDSRIMSGPLEAVKKRCKVYVELTQGREKPSKIAKMIQYKLKADDLDEVIRALPGECRIK